MHKANQSPKERQLPVFGCYELKQYLKTKKDAERGNKKMPGEAQRINDILEPYPNFSFLIDKLALERHSKKKIISNKIDMPQMPKFMSITQKGSNQGSAAREEELHHGGYQREEAG